MLHNRPVSKALVAQVAEVVSVAPHLLLQLWVAHGRADHVLIHRMGVLLQLAREVPQMVMHLQQRLRVNLLIGQTTWEKAGSSLWKAEKQ